MKFCFRRFSPLIPIPGTTALIVLSMYSGVGVEAQTLEDYARLAAFEYEQCANVCQMQFDEGIFTCPPYRQLSDSSVAEDCRASKYERFQMCLRTCPPQPKEQP